METDLSLLAFKVLSQTFFSPEGEPLEFGLADKRQTQDDPFDVMVFERLEAGLADANVRCVRAPGALVSPDMALIRPNLCKELGVTKLSEDSRAAIGIEVKKLERTPNGTVSRASGMDYNSTPPCGRVRVYDGRNPVDIRCFYLFVCSEESSSAGRRRLSALALCDGDLLNADFKYYIDVTGERTKDIGVGSYGDGANRNRPMVIFANPLGTTILDRQVTLVHRSSNIGDDEIRRVGTVSRTVVSTNQVSEFSCYRRSAQDAAQFSSLDPFPNPRRSEKTSGRGRFNLGISSSR